MKRIFTIPLLITQGFLFLMLIAGSYEIYQTNEIHGWTYNMTTIIGDQEFIREVSLTYNVILLGFIMWFILCIFILKQNIYGLEKHLLKEDLIDGEEKGKQK